VQVREIMSRQVVTVGPDTSAKFAGEVMAARGFAALPVVDDQNRLIGIVAEADVLRDRIPADPRLHLRRGTEHTDTIHPLHVRGVMTTAVRAVEASTDVSDVARLFVDGRLRSVPVVENEVVVGIVSRRDALKALVRPDEEIRAAVLHLVEEYTGDPGCWEVRVTDGMTVVRRTKGAPGVSTAVEEFAVEQLLRTVTGVVAVQVLTGSGAPTRQADAPPSSTSRGSSS
jgi:CBS domain-containing protein